jgi:putative polyketide hydroxylase
MEPKTSVLIVGGSLNGLTMALLLAHHGVRCLVVERHPSTTVQYKFRGISPRSMEIYRSLGIEAEIRQQQVASHSEGLVRAKNLSDPDPQWGGPAWPDVSEIGISPYATCDQDQLEPILIKHARALGADIRFGTELVHFEQELDGVRARTRDIESGEERTVVADYLVAADGANGSIRETLGIPQHGPGELQHWMNIIFKTDLPHALQGRPFTSAFVTDVNGTILPRDNDGHWLLAVQHSPKLGERVEDFDDAHCSALIRKAAGRSDFNISIIDARSWEVAGYVADRFRDGRAFLVGDNAHRMPPTGGFGGNTGIHDAHNLAWKLAMVLNGKADQGLLDSYDPERRPIAEATMAQALARLSAWFKDLSQRLPPPVPIVDEYHVVFGQVYRDGAFIPERDIAPAPFEDPKHPSGRPGSRAPHVVIARKKERLSIFDLFGRGFVLLTGSKGESWQKAAQEFIRQSSAEITSYRIGSDIEDLEGRWCEKYGVTDAGAVLVRPDGIVAWRATAADLSPNKTLKAVWAQIVDTPQIMTPSSADETSTG